MIILSPRSTERTIIALPTKRRAIKTGENRLALNHLKAAVTNREGSAAISQKSTKGGECSEKKKNTVVNTYL